MIIDGKAIAAQVKASLQGSDAKLAVIMVGDDPRFLGLCPQQGTRLRRGRYSVLLSQVAGYGVDQRGHRVYRRAQRVGGRYSRSASSPGTH